MIVTANPEINVEDLMHRIREEVALRKQKVAWVDPSIISLPRMSESEPALAVKDAYDLEEFLAYHDEDFVNTLYRTLLHREPDAFGRAHHLNSLRQGEITKLQLVHKFAQSPEGQSVGVNVTDIVPIKLGNTSRQAASIDIRGEYQLAEFLDFHDKDFIHVAYRGVLHRESDPEGYWLHLNALRQGTLSKVDILGHLRYSPEGNAAGTVISGLWVAFSVRKAFKLPVIGYLLALANYILRLPTAVKNFEKFEVYQKAALVNALADAEAAIYRVAETTRQALDHGAKNRAEAVKHINALAAATEGVLHAKADNERLTALTNHLVELGQNLKTLNQTVETKAATAQLEALAAQTAEKTLSLIKAIEIKADNERLTALTSHLVELVQRKADATELAATATRLADALTKKADVVEEEEDHLLDNFYASFEDRFRGTTEDIKQRVSVYLPVVREAKVGTKTAPILDVGCGRGEWLELLRENDLVARGVDLNRVMVSRCQALGLEVAEADVIDYLGKLETNSLGAVTGMHIIEHIPFKRLIALFDEVLRVLKPGGIAIFETPNPENLQVGACGFYNDPTHLHPLPPHLSEALLEFRGFLNPKILRINQEQRRQHAPQTVPNNLPGAASINPMVDVMRDNFYVSPDYAVIASKA